MSRFLALPILVPLFGMVLTLASVRSTALQRTFGVLTTVVTAGLSITKTSNTGTATSGGNTTYTIVATNNGPSPSNNAVVRDDWTTLPGLNCSAGPATCVASGTAGTQCPAAASVTPAALQAGLAIPVFPNGGIVTFTLQCAVTATGL